MDVEYLEIELDMLRAENDELKVFTLGVLSAFHKRLQEMEKRHDDEMGHIRNATVETGAIQQGPEWHSTPKHNENKSEQAIGACSQDQDEEDFKKELAAFLPSHRDAKEKLQPEGIAFVAWFVDKNGVTGRREDGTRLYREGIRRGIWSTKALQESGIQDQDKYFSEKIRTYNRRQKRLSTKGQLAKALEENIANDLSAAMDTHDESLTAAGGIGV